jgi:hypothetical protein
MEPKHLNLVVLQTNALPPTRIKPTRKRTTVATQERWLQEVRNDPLKHAWTIVGDRNEPLGFVSVELSGLPSRIARLFSFADNSKVVDGEQRGVEQAIERCFNELGVNRIEVELLEADVFLFKLYERLGFRREIVRKEHHWANSVYHTTVLMGLLAEDHGSKDRIQTNRPD